MSQFKLVENIASKPDAIYDINNEAGLYLDIVGTKQRFLTETPCLNPLVNNGVNKSTSLNIFNFYDNYNNYWYDIYNSYILITGRIVKDSDNTSFSPYDKIRLLSDCWMQRLSLMIGGVEINNNIGAKNNIHLTAHLLNLLNNTPSWRDKVAKFIHFYPDSGTAGGAVTQKYNVNARVGTLLNDGIISGSIDPNLTLGRGAVGDGDYVVPVIEGNSQNVILVGIQNSIGSQSYGLAPNTINPLNTGGTDAQITSTNQLYKQITSDIALGGATTANINQSIIGYDTSADGNIYFDISDNPLYNKEFNDACNLYANSAYFAVHVPLRFYCPALTTLQGLYTGFNLSISMTLPSYKDMFYSANRGVDDANLLPAQGNIQFKNLIYRIPTYIPDDEQLILLKKKLNSDIIERRNYLDYDVYKSDLITPFNGFNTINFSNVIGTKPKYVILGFKQSISEGVQTGNIHNWFNPQIQNLRIRIGNTVYIPSNKSFSCEPSTNDYTELFAELLKMQENTMRSGEWDEKMIDYNTFINHKFLCVFDCNEIETEVFDLQTAVDLTVEITTNNSAIGGGANTPLQASRTGDIIRVPLNNITVFTDPTAGTAPITIPNPGLGIPLAPFYCYAFIVQERHLDVYFSDQGLQVQAFS